MFASWVGNGRGFDSNPWSNLVRGLALCREASFETWATGRKWGPVGCRPGIGCGASSVGSHGYEVIK